jgi:hypothetical protein
MSEELLWNLQRGALAVDLGLPERLAREPQRIDDDVTYRIPRALASDGVFEEVEPRERTEEQWRVLLGASGWEPTRFGAGVIEARPCR